MNIFGQTTTEIKEEPAPYKEKNISVTLKEDGTFWGEFKYLTPEDLAKVAKFLDETALKILKGNVI